MTKPNYEMRLSLNVLEHLGINLYSNVPAVLSEIVANAWDADATLVTIDFDKDLKKITIFDNGIGMTEEDINKRFLMVGYQRRNEASKTAKGRNPMGRKGIGKLSLFSIAEQIDIETARKSEKHAFQMRHDKIREIIDNEAEGTYRPEVTDPSGIDFSSGTRITLTKLKKKQTIKSSENLRTRLARRFSIIGAKYKFTIKVNNTEVVPTDRNYYDKIQYIWTYGDQSEVVKLCKNRDNNHEDKRKDGTSGMKITGWIGTVAESKQLNDDSDKALKNRIAIFVRGKMAQEDILNEFSEYGIYATYLLGELHIDALDDDGKPDSATSSRQKIVEDDERYIVAKEFIQSELKHIQKKWSELRSEEGAKKAVKIPAIEQWLENVPNPEKPRAKRWLGKIYQIKTDSSKERQQLWKFSIIAFEFYMLTENLERLENIDAENIESAVALFRELDSLEASLYGQIIKNRIEVISSLDKHVKDIALEKVIQKHLSKHLWLLDPAWDRIESETYMETKVENMFTKIDKNLSNEVRNGRVDIAYRKTAGTHVIIELKRSNVAIKHNELADQIEKYRMGLEEILEKMGSKNDPIEIICLVEKKPVNWDKNKKTIIKTLEAQKARLMFYSELIRNNLRMYSDYQKKKKKVNRLQGIIDSIEDYKDT